MIDSHTDKSKSLIQALALRIGSNDFLKVAEHVAESEKPILSVDYADPENKLYPCHTKEATLVNFVYFVDQASAYTKQAAERIGNRFEKKLAFWDLEYTAADIIASVRKSEPVKYAMEIDGNKYFGYNDANTLKIASEDFYRNRHMFPYSSRQSCAKHILKVAEKLNTELSNDVVRYCRKAAGWAMADFEGMVATVRSRAHNDRHRKVASYLGEVAECLEHFEKNPGSLLYTEKMASFINVVEGYDKLTGISKDYKVNGVPEERIYKDQDIEKIAEELENTVELTNGVSIIVDDALVHKIAKADPELGKDISGSVEKAVDILPTLPKPDADYIVETCI